MSNKVEAGGQEFLYFVHFQEDDVDDCGMYQTLPDAIDAINRRVTYYADYSIDCNFDIYRAPATPFKQGSCEMRPIISWQE